MIEYRDCLTQEQRDSLELLSGDVRLGNLSIVNEWRSNGYLRSHSVGLTTFKLPEVIIYGLKETEVAPFFETYYQALRDPGSLSVYPELKVGKVAPDTAVRLVPLLKCIFPDGFELIQILWPDERGLYPGQLWYDAKLKARQPKLWGVTKLPSSVVPDLVLKAERTAEKRANARSNVSGKSKPKAT